MAGRYALARALIAAGGGSSARPRIYPLQGYAALARFLLLLLLLLHHRKHGRAEVVYRYIRCRYVRVHRVRSGGVRVCRRVYRYPATVAAAASRRKGGHIIGLYEPYRSNLSFRARPPPPRRHILAHSALQRDATAHASPTTLLFAFSLSLSVFLCTYTYMRACVYVEQDQAPHVHACAVYVAIYRYVCV